MRIMLLMHASRVYCDVEGCVCDATRLMWEESQKEAKQQAAVSGFARLSKVRKKEIIKTL